MGRRAAVILAAGQGTRMRSPLPKVLHPIAGRPMLDHAIDAAQALGCEKIVVVVGVHAPEVGVHVARRLGEGAIAVQDPPLGTGHAVLAARDALADFDGDVVVTYADCPLIRALDIEPLFDLRDGGAAMAVLGFHAADPSAYGRLVLTEQGLERIVEAREATPEELAIRACNSGVLAASRERLFGWLARVTNANAKGEYYLTDVVGLARTEAARVAVAFAPESALMGVNAQGELAQAEAAWQSRRRAALLDSGVTLTAPETVHLSFDTQIEPGARIDPYVVFGPGVRVCAGAHVRSFSALEGAVVRPAAQVGPFSRLRPGADIGSGAHIGNFVEVKNVVVGEGAKANHLAYLGDGEVGPGANIGAGVIFCNYDGFFKHRTEVGEGAFIGSNSALVAPVRIGAEAYVGSGSVIVKDVASGALALERGVQVEKAGWAMRFRTAMQAKKERK